MENCKLSLILPVYNVENYLKPCLESLVSQNFECMEIIAVNDGSTDRSPEILKDFQSRFPEKIKIFTTETEVSATPEITDFPNQPENMCGSLTAMTL